MDIKCQNQMLNTGVSCLSTSVKTSLESCCENWVHWIWRMSLLKSFFQRNDGRKQHKICVGCLWVFLGIARKWSCISGIEPDMAVSYSYISSKPDKAGKKWLPGLRVGCILWFHKKKKGKEEGVFLCWICQIISLGVWASSIPVMAKFIIPYIGI